MMAHVQYNEQLADNNFIDRRCYEVIKTYNRMREQHIMRHGIA